MPSIESSSNLFYINTPIHAFQNVGIGTSSPVSSLHVVGTTSVGGDILPTACNVYDLGSSNYRFRDMYLSGNTIDMEGIQISKNLETGGISIKTATNELLDTSIRNLIAMGSVGIGSSSPVTALDVSGIARCKGQMVVYSTTAVQGGQLTFGYGNVPSIATQSNASWCMDVYNKVYRIFNISETGTLTNDFHIAENGNVGIGGVSIPSAKLHVIGNTISTGNIGIGTETPLARTHIHHGASTGDIFRVDDQTLETTPFVIREDGNVGIGTYTALEKLHVNGNINMYASSPAIYLTRNQGGYGSDSATDYKVINNAGKFMIHQNRLGTGETELLTMNNSGEVGIGTTIPLAKMHMYSTANSDIFRVDDNTAPDSTPFIINKEGNVGISTTNPLNPLHVDGTIRYTNRPAAATITAIGFDANGILTSSSSSLRFKHNIQPYTKSVSDVQKLKPVTYNYIGENILNAGLIAENLVEDGFDEFVVKNAEGQPESVPYGNIVTILINAVKELASSNQMLFDEIALLRH